MKWDGILCQKCKREAAYYLDGLCMDCYNERPKTVEEWLAKISDQCTAIETRISAINEALRGAK
jgi:NMD protein affecting ribosome stability and mRNA decay